MYLTWCTVPAWRLLYLPGEFNVCHYVITLFSPNIIFSLKVYWSGIHTHSSFLLVSFVWYTILHLLLSTFLCSPVSLANIHLRFHFSVSFLTSNNYYYYIWSIYYFYIVIWFSHFFVFFPLCSFSFFLSFLGKGGWTNFVHFSVSFTFPSLLYSSFGL